MTKQQWYKHYSEVRAFFKLGFEYHHKHDKLALHVYVKRSEPDPLTYNAVACHKLGWLNQDIPF
jgi:hypothetical protein